VKVPEGGEGAGVKTNSSQAPRESTETSSDWSSAFQASVVLDCQAMTAKTETALLQPEIDVVEVADASVVIRLSKLTGERFELTVYASGAGELLGSAATLVQRGPVRTSESTQRIGPLQASQVYVAWVKVFSEQKSRDSKQKGFKTLEEKEKTIWDEKDHVILGLSPDATAKEITRSWRQLSLQYHPDKILEEAEKDKAEEMQKRLNLAKANMLKCASSARGEDESPDNASEMSPSGAHGRGQSSSDFGMGLHSDDSDDDHEVARRRHGMAGFNHHSFFEDDSSESEEEEPKEPEAEEDGQLRCSLNVQASNPPSLKIIERGLKYLRVEAAGLPADCMFEVMKTKDGSDLWEVASPQLKATSPTMRVTLQDLEESTSYRLRLRTHVQIEPLRFTFAEFAPDKEKPSAEAASQIRQGLGQESSGPTVLDPVSEGEDEATPSEEDADSSDSMQEHETMNL